jgi:hypothetical protein
LNGESVAISSNVSHPADSAADHLTYIQPLGFQANERHQMH